MSDDVREVSRAPLRPSASLTCRLGPLVSGTLFLVAHPGVPPRTRAVGSDGRDLLLHSVPPRWCPSTGSEKKCGEHVWHVKRGRGRAGVAGERARPRHKGAKEGPRRDPRRERHKAATVVAGGQRPSPRAQAAKPPNRRSLPPRPVQLSKPPPQSDHESHRSLACRTRPAQTAPANRRGAPLDLGCLGGLLPRPEIRGSQILCVSLYSFRTW